MKALTTLVKWLVGSLFIFSGLVKLNDPLGFAYKLEDYFAADVLNLPFLIPYTLFLAIVIVLVEILLGVGLLLGYRIKATLNLLLAMIVFFTFLTFYSAYFNKVTDCGCFGDAIPLTPWQSFYKDIILLILIGFLIFNKKHLTHVMSVSKAQIALLTSLALGGIMAWYVLNYLPIKDFRPYAVGKNLSEGMKSAEEIGLQSPKYLTIYTLKNKENGKTSIVDSDTYVAEKWWEKSEWEIQSNLTKSKKVSDGYEPPIHDFSIIIEGEDLTESLLQEPLLMMVITKDVEKAKTKYFAGINQIAQEVEKAGGKIVGLSASPYAATEELRHEAQAAYPFAEADKTTLKTIVRANPGVLILHRGTVVAKFSGKGMPKAETLVKEGIIK